jgi:hypothetical protein
MVVGSYNGRGSADIFAMTGGVGTNKAIANLPAGATLLQGTQGHPDAHIDVYGACDSGTQQAIVNILYTSP